MTNKLPREILKQIDQVISNMDDIKFHSDDRYCDFEECKRIMKTNIIVHLSPYLSLPQEQEPKPQIEQIPHPIDKGLSEYDIQLLVMKLIDTVNKQQEQINSLLPTKQDD